MKILYDHQIFTAQKYGGISRYYCELYSHISQVSDIIPKISVFYSENAYYSQLFPHKIHIPENNFPGKQTSIHLLNKYYSIIHLIKKNYEIFHPTYYDPYFLQYIKGKPFVLTVHDMIHELFPQYFSLDDTTIRDKKRLIEMADSIIAVSQNTKRDIIKYYDIDEKIINVIYHGNSLYTTQKPGSLIFPSDYILFVGDRHTYKNFYRFLKAIAPILSKYPSLHLVCAGGKGFSQQETALMNNLSIRKKVVWYPITNETLYHIYKNALCFVFPTLYEGFGIPILESFFSGCPSVLSTGGSLPEIGGDAAVYFDPYDEESIRHCIENVIADESLRTKLREKGYRRVKEFSWMETARKTVEVYQRTIDSE